MIGRYVISYLGGVALWLIGIPFLLLQDLALTGYEKAFKQPRKTDKWPVLDSLFGNSIDGIDGDVAYRSRVPKPFLRRWRWCALRNPVNNYLRMVGPNGLVSEIRPIDKGLVQGTVAVIGGKRYFFVRIKLSRAWQLWFGYRLFRDDRTDSRLEIGHHLENAMLLWPVKKVQ